MSESHKATLAKANAAIVQGDFERFLQFCTEDTKWTFVGDRTLNGKQAVRQWMENAYRELPRFNVHRMIAEGDFLTALGEITLNDENGKETRYAYSDVWRFRDGKLAEVHAFVVETVLESGAFE
jgi:ketosteroid isomerase-like protein